MDNTKVVKILELLEKDSSLTDEEIGSLIGEKAADVTAEVKRLTKEGFICGYQAVIDWGKENEEKADALIEVKVSPQRDKGFDAIANDIAKFDEVSAVYLMSGGYDFAVMLERKTMKEISKFVFEKLATLPSISGTSTHFILRKYKDHKIVMGEGTKDRRVERIL
jgi:DNA-binding Lrp family transcriptional regulator